jgi:hypothetical protein
LEDVVEDPAVDGPADTGEIGLFGRIHCYDGRVVRGDFEFVEITQILVANG